MKLASLILLLLAPAVSASTWECRNPDLEVSCGEDSCSAATDQDFTPMSIAFNDSGSVSLCLYSGCWEGEGEVSRTEHFLGILADKLLWAPDVNNDREQQHAAILADLKDNIATLKLGGYVQPLLCTRRDE